MKIIVVGAGKAGIQITGSLVAEGHDVCVVDNIEEKIDHISNLYDIMCVLGSGTDIQVQKDAGCETCDVFIAVTKSDETNLLCCMCAHRLGAKYTIARIRDPINFQQVEFFRSSMGISSCINQDYECARQISRILKFPQSASVDRFSRSRVELVEYVVPEGSGFVGKKLIDLKQNLKMDVLIAAAERDGGVIIPRGDFEIKSGDRLSIIGETYEIGRLFSETGTDANPIHKLIIIGGSRICVYLAKLVERMGIDITIIEKDMARCEKLCSELPKVKVVCADGSHSMILQEEGLKESDAFVALTSNDGTNISISLYAKSKGLETVITKITGDQIEGLTGQLGLQSILTPHKFVSDQVVRYVRALAGSVGSNFETMYRIANGKAEALEFIATENSKCLGVQLKELKIKPEVIIGAITRKGSPIPATGDTTIEKGDHVIIVTTLQRCKDLDEILA